MKGEIYYANWTHSKEIDFKGEHLINFDVAQHRKLTEVFPTRAQTNAQFIGYSYISHYFNCYK